jgi:hypothetical protein
MQRTKMAWAALPMIVGPIGTILGRAHIIGPNPGTYFALGALAACCLAGIAYGFIEGARVAREGRQIRN